MHYVLETNSMFSCVFMMVCNTRWHAYVLYNSFEKDSVLLAGLFCFLCILVRQRSGIVKRGRHVTKISQRMKAKRVWRLSCNGGQREQEIFSWYFNGSLSRQIFTVLFVVLVDVSGISYLSVKRAKRNISVSNLVDTAKLPQAQFSSDRDILARTLTPTKLCLYAVKMHHNHDQHNRPFVF